VQLEALRGALAPAARPWVQKNSNGCCFERTSGGGCRLPAIGTPVPLHPQPAGEGSANGDVGVVVATATGRAVLFPAGGKINKTCGWFHPALLEGAEAAFAPGPSTRQADGYAACGPCGAPLRGRGVAVAFLTGLTRAGRRLSCPSQDSSWRCRTPGLEAEAEWNQRKNSSSW